jgi:ferrochelatase
VTAAAGRIAVVLFNLGGPEGPEGVRPFLQSLFGDPAILALPDLIRKPAAWVLAGARLRAARANYALMGGGSPLLSQTLAQAASLEIELLSLLAPARPKVFVAMRHAAPLADETAAQVAAFDPDEIVLVPLYPQYSTTTTVSSLRAWNGAYKGRGASRAVCCWYDNPGLIEAHVELITGTWERAGRPPVRLLFSAHGLPLSVVSSGDPYQWQVEATCARVAARLGPSWDWQICYQSRVGPMKWLGPSTPEAITRAAAGGLGVLVDPIAFVSEHVETLVELDHDYRRVASAAGAAPYLRVPAAGTSAAFITGLAAAVARALERRWDGPDGAPCPTRLARCGRAAVAEVAS